METVEYLKMAETENEHWWFCGRRAIVDAILATLDLPSHARIVEIGAGTGGNLPMLERYGQVTAVEMSDVARQIVRERMGRDLLDGYLPDQIPLQSGSADLVCLFDVLEHVAEDEASLDAIFGMLGPGGRLLLTVPAHQWMWSAHDESLHHFRRYSRKGLRERLEAAGFVIDRLTYTNAALFPVAALARLADRLRGSEQPSGHNTPSAPVNAAMKALFSSESLIVPRFNLPMGVSLLAVCRKLADSVTSAAA